MRPRKDSASFASRVMPKEAAISRSSSWDGGRTGIFLLFVGKGRRLRRFCLGRLLESKLLNRNFTHFEFLDFSRHRHGKVVGHFKIPGNLVLCDLAFAELL